MRSLTPAAQPAHQGARRPRRLRRRALASGTRSDRTSVACGDEGPVVALKDPRQEMRA